jgi:hypothetical protein
MKSIWLKNFFKDARPPAPVQGGNMTSWPQTAPRSRMLGLALLMVALASLVMCYLL